MEGRLESLLNQRVKIKILDGRIFTGNFLCTDQGSNLIISDTVEYVGIEEQRPLGCWVMIPGTEIVSISVFRLELLDS